MKVRLTGAQTSEPKSEEVCFTMKWDEEDTSSDFVSSLEDTRKVGTNKVVRINRSKPTLGDSEEFCYNTILDSSTEWAILGGPAWSLIKRFNCSLNMSAVDNTMSSVAMQLCDAVIAILDENGQSIWFPNGDNVLLEYDATKYKLFAKCHLQIPMEVKIIPIQ
eukprot:8324802-Ditylum_brightwellii.AAC.4